MQSYVVWLLFNNNLDLHADFKSLHVILSPDVGALDMDNFQLENPETFNGMQAYKNSKLCNVLTAYRMADKLHGQNVMVNAVDPGTLTNLW